MKHTINFWRGTDMNRRWFITVDLVADDYYVFEALRRTLNELLSTEVLTIWIKQKLIEKGFDFKKLREIEQDLHLSIRISEEA